MTIQLLENIKKAIVQPLIGLLFLIAMFYFVWGVVEYIQGASEPAKRTDGAKHMIWGAIGLFIMASVTGILQIVCATVECV